MKVTVLGDGLAACTTVAALAPRSALSVEWVVSGLHVLDPQAPVPGVFLINGDDTSATRFATWVANQARQSGQVVEAVLLPIELTDLTILAEGEPLLRMGIVDISALTHALITCIKQCGVAPRIAPEASFVWNGNQVVGLTLDESQVLESDQVIWATGVDVQRRFRKTSLDYGRHGARVVAHTVSNGGEPPSGIRRWMQALYFFPFAEKVWLLGDLQLLNSSIAVDEPHDGVPMFDGIAWTAQRSNPGLILVGVNGGEGLLALPLIAPHVERLLELGSDT
jgi:hypothetical protein